MNIFKIALILLCVVLLFAGCHSQVAYNSDTVLVYKLHGMDIQAQLTEEEAKMVADMFDGKETERWFDWDVWELKYYGYGCPFDHNVCIRIGDITCYIGYDGCRTVRIGEGDNVPHIELTNQEEQKLLELFSKYTGLEKPY